MSDLAAFGRHATCTRCGLTKPLTDYQRQAGRRDDRRPACKQCAAAADASRYRQNHADRLAQAAEYREARRSKFATAAAAYRKARPEANWRGGYRRRAQHFGFEPVVEMFTRADVVSAYGDRCWYCDDGAFEQPDHFVPVCQGGEHTLSNIRPCCGPCNRAKARGERASGNE